MHLYIHAWDPGGTTGYAVLRVHHTQSRPEVLSTHALRHGAFDFAEIGENWHKVHVQEGSSLHVHVLEKFRLFAGSAQHLIHDDMIAAVRRGCVEYLVAQKGQAIYYQAPSAMKGFSIGVLQSRLDFSGLVQYPSTVHEWDALRHGAYFFYRHLERGTLWALPPSELEK